jgi:DNA-binding NarL/FixJ family response regulator
MKRARRATAVAPPSGFAGARFEFQGEEFVVLSVPVASVDTLSNLTEAERCVIHGVLEGMSNALIARQRGSSRRTVANQIASAFRKLRVRSRSELAARLS